MNKSSSGDMELSAKCFQDLVLKDHNHPAALINYAAELLCKHSSTVAGAGANGGADASEDQKAPMNVAKECLLAALRSDPKSAHAWVNLANSYYMMGDHRSSSKCLEKVLLAHFFVLRLFIVFLILDRRVSIT
jgi:tetratricopeptide (TPR) repeat protein